MKHYEVTVKERGKDALLHPTYVGDVDKEFLVRFFGLDEPDVEWYEINEVSSETHVCCICGKEFIGYGNNPSPVMEEGLCCDDCNATVVVPQRMERLI